MKAIAALLKGTDTLFVVDAITGLGTTHFEVDNRGIDILIGGSQKAVMIPPGLAYLCVSERAWQRMETASSRAITSICARSASRRPRANRRLPRRSRWSADWLRRSTTFTAAATAILPMDAKPSSTMRKLRQPWSALASRPSA